jgi:hypothetical protein
MSDVQELRFKDFSQRWEKYTLGVVDTIPEGAIVAGGAVMACACPKMTDMSGDIDVWIHGESSEMRKDRFDKTLDAIAAQLDLFMEHHILNMRFADGTVGVNTCRYLADIAFKRGVPKGMTVTTRTPRIIYAKKGPVVTLYIEGYPKTIQVILTEFEAKEEVILNFELDATQALYDPSKKEIHISRRCATAWETMKSTWAGSGERESYGSSSRLTKLRRKGFNIDAHIRNTPIIAEVKQEFLFRPGMSIDMVKRMIPGNVPLINIGTGRDIIMNEELSSNSQYQ